MGFNRLIRIAPAVVFVLVLAGTLASLAESPGPDVLLLSPRGQPVEGYPEGAPAATSDVLTLTDEDVRQLKTRGFKAAIAMQALDTPWNALQVEAISNTLEQYDIPVIGVTDAAQNPSRQNRQLAELIARKPDIIFSVPIDPASQAEAYKSIAAHGIKLVFMDNVAIGLKPGKDYATVVASDNESGATFAANQLIQAINGEGEVGLITFSFESYHSVTVRRKAFERVVAKTPSVRLVATETFTQPSEAYTKTIAMLREHPNIKGIFAVWADPAMQARAAAKSMGRGDVAITTMDLGPDSAIYIAENEIFATGAQLPYDLGVAEAKAGAIALLGRPLPPYVSLPVLGVTKGNLLPSLQQVTKKQPPPALQRICESKCGN